MATKKPAVKEPEEEVLEGQISAEEVPQAEEPAKPRDEWDEEIEMFVPRRPKGDDPQYYVCVNDRRFAVPANGKMQKLPKPIAEILKSSLEAEAAADEMAESMSRHAAENAQGL